VLALATSNAWAFPLTGRSTINGSVTINTNLHGLVLGKTYPGISESYPRNTDGSLSGTSIGGTSATITYPTPQDRVTNYGGGLAMSEHFYNVGLRASVTAPGDARTFTYYHLEPRRETHVDGTLNGWSVEWLPDAQDRPATLRVSKGGVTRDFSVLYDANGRIWQSTSAQMTGTYTPNAMGEVETLQRGALLTTTWSYDALGRFAGVTNSGTNFNYTYPDRDARGRIIKRLAATGIGWSGLQYDARDQLLHALPSVGAAMDYRYDARGNRTSQPAVATQAQANGLDQIGAQTLLSQIYGVTGTVTPGAQVWAFRPGEGEAGEPLSVNPVTGEYRRSWDATLGEARQLEILVRGILPGAGAQGHDAVAERKVSVALPSAAETFVYDAAGRLKEDGYWLYTWDAAGRLIGMDTATIGSLTEPGALWESLEFGYDADGRRTWKKRRVAYLDDRPQKLETSRVLYAGWLPVMEERSGFPGNVAARRWFQWGADLSGTREGAGGIGGLVAIIEEHGVNSYRTLLPVQDGLGNVTGLIDTATNHTIARYDYGPFGEPLGESGETDACPFRWQTKWYDPETQLCYFGHRYYTPRTARWLSRDPMGEDGGFNLYAYCGNDPVNKHDPLGQAVWENETILDLTSRIQGIPVWQRQLARARFSRNFLVGQVPHNLQQKEHFENKIVALGSLIKDLDSRIGQARRDIADFDAFDANADGIIGGNEEDSYEHATNSTSPVFDPIAFFTGAFAARAVISPIAISNIAAAEINPRLVSKLKAFKEYTSNGGTMELARWHRATIRHYGGDGGVFNSGFSEWFRNTNGKLNGNSLLATGPHDVYVIRGIETGRILHFGETGRGYLTRFEEHFDDFSELGIGVRVDLLGTVEGKAAARALENRYINTYLKIFGERPLFNPVSR
jgi:RHS repeat-associated protein